VLARVLLLPSSRLPRGIVAKSVLDPDLLAVLLAFGFAGALALPGLRKAIRRTERFCVNCGRRVLLGQRTCDCD
jgi:hypothetical protein